MRLLDEHFIEVANHFTSDVQMFRRSLTVVDITNVAEWDYTTHGDQFAFEELNCLISPWTMTWYEYKIRQNGPIAHLWKDDLALACLVICLPKSFEQTKNIKPTPENDGWMLIVHCFGFPKPFERMKDGKRYQSAPVLRYGTFRLDLDAGGSIPVGTSFELLNIDLALHYLQKQGRTREDALDEVGRGLQTLAGPALFGIQFCHCKNVSLTAEPDSKLRTIKNRERHERGEVPLVRYHTLTISTVRKLLEGEGQIHALGMKRALHLCRGHFRHYDETHKLFGRLTGTFWIPMHLRGDSGVGLSPKDYRVAAPKTMEGK